MDCFFIHETLTSYLFIPLRDREFNRAAPCWSCLLSRNSCWLVKWLANIQLVTFTSLFLYCCGASVACEQQPNQGLRGIYLRLLEFITFYQNALNLTAPLFARVHCVTNNTMMSHRRAVVLFHVDSSEPNKPI